MKRKRRLFYIVEDISSQPGFAYSLEHRCWCKDMPGHDRVFSVRRKTLRQAYREAMRLVSVGGRPKISRFRWQRGGWRDWNSYTYRV